MISKTNFQVGVFLLHVPDHLDRRSLLRDHPVQHGQAADQAEERRRRLNDAGQGNRPHLLRQTHSLDSRLLHLHPEPGFRHAGSLLSLHSRSRLDRCRLLRLLRLLFASIPERRPPQQEEEEVRHPEERKIEERAKREIGSRRGLSRNRPFTYIYQVQLQ